MQRNIYVYIYIFDIILDISEMMHDNIDRSITQ